MKIVIDDQYYSDENKPYTVDENGNINLFINIGDEEGNSNTLEEGSNINYKEEENVIESDFTEFQEDTNKDSKEECEDKNTEEIIVNEVEEVKVNSTINSENPWEEEQFSRNYSNIYAEIENNLEKKYANKSENKEVESYSSEPIHNIYKEEIKVEKPKEEKGRINVFSRLGNKEGVELKGARINLYLLNGVSPKLYDSKFTDSSGKAEFNNLPNGCYRIISIVDRRFFEKPVYYNWNEVTIDSNNKNSNVLVVNRIKPGYYRK